MPKPKAGETQSHFMNRCVPQVIEDGTAKNQKQAVAICMSMYRGKDMSNARKKRKEQSVADEPQADKEMELMTDDEAEVQAKSFIEEMPNMYPPQQIEVVEKDDEKMAEVMPSLPFGGAQSWEELKEYMDAENASQAVRKTEYEFSVMVNNVLNDPDMEVTEKGNKIAALADGFSGRADENVEKDVEPDVITKIASFLGLEEIAKARMTRASINDLPDSAFAYVEPGGKKDDGGKTTPRGLRHYPIHDKAHIRNALARASQQIGKGGKSADIARKALPKIKAAAKKMGVGKSSSFIVQKDIDGNYRWVGWVSNKYRDRDKVAHPKGEILSDAAHKEFVAYVDADPTNRMPQLWLWHTIGTATKHRADFVDYTDGFLVESGPLTKEEGELFEQLEKEYDLAMSHGFFRDERAYDAVNGIINKYRQFEASVLPREHVANEWTDFATLQEVKDMFTPTKRKYLVDALGEDKVTALEASTKDMAEELKALGVEFKEAEDEETQPVEVEETEEAEPEAGKDIDVAALNQFLVGQNEQIESIQKSVDGLTKVVIELAKSDDEKIAQQITPKAHVAKEVEPIWLKSASQSDKTLIDENDEKDKKLLESKPKNDEGSTGWVGEALGTATDPGASVSM